MDSGTPGPAACFATVEGDMGAVAQGMQPSFIFELTNSGSSALSIFAVRSSCGCTAVSFPKIIEPGAAGAIELRLNTSGMSGRVRKSVTVESNDERLPNRELWVVASVVPPVLTRPRIVTIDVNCGDAASAVLSLSAGTVKRFKVVAAHVSPGALHVDYSDALLASHEATIRVPQEWSAGKAGTQLLKLRLVIVDEEEVEYAVEVPVHIKTHAIVEIEPANLILEPNNGMGLIEVRPRDHTVCIEDVEVNRGAASVLEAQVSGPPALNGDWVIQVSARDLPEGALPHRSSLIVRVKTSRATYSQEVLVLVARRRP
ncbi:MAG: DUF1573 domain-containing protein [Dehalococcoidia bacterium]